MKITMILDFVCPYCFVGEKVLEKALKEKNIKPEYKFLPYELSPEPNPQPIVNEGAREYFKKNIENWAKEEGIEINFPTISPKPRTALAFEGLYTAEKYDKGVDYIRAVLEAYWIHNKDIGNLNVLVEIADDLRIPKFEFEDSLLSSKYSEAHRKLNAEVSEFDFDVVPTFYINDEKLESFPRKVKEWIQKI
ncbi:DsbA family oxidoreductase [Cetobacterium sp.]|uniref:DsbA family oxidoreductase n=2 Tax=Cetobacterium sp. TaxID=2071632 RepID=UPI002FC7D60D